MTSPVRSLCIRGDADGRSCPGGARPVFTWTGSPGVKLAQELQLELERRHAAALLPHVARQSSDLGERLDPAAETRWM